MYCYGNIFFELYMRPSPPFNCVQTLKIVADLLSGEYSKYKLLGVRFQI
jgi:hypothetical protein